MYGILTAVKRYRKLREVSDMERSGYVSLWVGNFGTFENALAYIEKNYSDEAQEDDELYKSELMREYGIDIDSEYDEDFADCICHGRKTKSLTELINGCSYCKAVTWAFVSDVGDELPDSFDSAILLYDYNYDNSAEIGTCHRAVFIGSVKVNDPEYGS